MIRNAAFALSLSLILAACGSTQVANPSGSKPAPDSSAVANHPSFTGFEIVGQSSNVSKRRITLPPLKTMGLKTQSLHAQATSLPAWSGPRDLGNYGDTTFDINSKGEFFTQKLPHDLLPLTLNKYSSTGQLIATKASDSKMGFIETLDRDKSIFLAPNTKQWLVVTEDSPAEETYQIVNSQGGHYYGDQTDDGMQLLAEVYGTSLTPLRASTDPVYPVFLFDTLPTPFYQQPYNNSLTIKAGKQGVVMSTRRFSPSYSTTPTNRVDVYEAAHLPWEEVGVTNKTSLLSPKELPDQQVTTHFDVAPDGSVYVAVFIPWDTSCYSFCPSYASLTKFVNGQVVWQDYWETADSVYLEDVAADNNGASLLVTSGRNPSSYIADQSTIVSFNSNSNPTTNVQLPLTELRNSFTQIAPQFRASFATQFTGLKTNGSGKFLAYDNNVILSGTLDQGFDKTFIGDDKGNGSTYDDQPTFGISDVKFKGDYVYVRAGRGEMSSGILAFDSNLQSR